MKVKSNLTGVALIVCICMAVVIFQGDWAKPLHKVAEAAVVRLANIIRLHPTPPVFGDQTTKNQATGLKITEIVSGAPGQYAGFEVGNTVLEINGVKIANEQAFSDAIDRAGRNARIKVLCGRTGQTLEVEVDVNKI